MGEVRLRTPKQSSPDLCVGGRNINNSQWSEVRTGVWFLASELYSLEDLQIFAETVESTDSLDIKRTAEILANAQLELRALINNRAVKKICKG